MELKTCFKCNMLKPRGEFYSHPKMADGLLGKCKECARSDIAANRRDPEKGERIRAYDRKRGNRQSPEYSRAYASRYPEKHAARSALANAVRGGKIAKPKSCQQCGAGGRIHGHHHDYTKPLDVQWLCPPCHGLQHRKYDAEAA
jgi:hypothetical protein